MQSCRYCAFLEDMPEVGSEAGCEAMDETPTGDWTVNQAADFARHCLLKAPDRDQPQ